MSQPWHPQNGRVIQQRVSAGWTGTEYSKNINGSHMMNSNDLADPLTSPLAPP